MTNPEYVSAPYEVHFAIMVPKKATRRQRRKIVKKVFGAGKRRTKHDVIQTIKRLEDSLINTSGECSAGLCKELEAGGINVARFLSRLRRIVRAVEFDYDETKKV